MAIRGFFSDSRLTLTPHQAPTAVPYVRTVIYLPDFNVRAVVTFLIDTGADLTTLHPQDSLRLLTADQIRAIGNPVAFGGAGAGKDHYAVRAQIFFGHDDAKRVHQIDLTAYIADPPHNSEFESLLGRDVLEHFVMNFDQRARAISLGT